MNLKNVIQLIILNLSLVCSLNCISWAQAKPGQAVLQTIQELKSKGINQVGDLNLDQLAQRIKRIQWRTVDVITQPPAHGKTQEIHYLAGLGSDGKLRFQLAPDTADTSTPLRKSAYYQTENPSVVMSQSLPTDTSDAKSQLELHESMGALGYNDKHYSLSTALTVLNQIRDPKLRQQLLNTYGNTLFKKNNLQSYGGSSVGGGGDILAIVIKNQVMQKILQSRHKVLPDFYVSFPQIAFEPFYDEQYQFVGTEYELRLMSGIKKEGDIEGIQRNSGLQELITIHFPALNWTKSPDQRPLIIQQVADILLSIFPVYEDSETISFTPQGCPSGVSVSYPKQIVPGLFSILEMRSLLINDCGGLTSDWMPVSGMKIKVPSW